MEFWKLRSIEAIAALVLASTLVFLVLFVAGCSTNTMQVRRELFAPAPLNTPDTRPTFVDGYAKALADAQANPNSLSIATYTDACSALNTRNCVDWTARLTLARRGLIASDHNIGVFEGLLTTVMGIAKASSTAVAGVGAVEVALQGFGNNLQADVLGAPSQYQAQTAIFGLLGSCNDQLAIDAPSLKFSAAYARCEACARVCSFDAASAAANTALQATPIVVHPSGALRAVRP